MALLHDAFLTPQDTKGARFHNAAPVDETVPTTQYTQQCTTQSPRHSTHTSARRSAHDKVHTSVHDAMPTTQYTQQCITQCPRHSTHSSARCSAGATPAGTARVFCPARPPWRISSSWVRWGPPSAAAAGLLGLGAPEVPPRERARGVIAQPGGYYYYYYCFF